MRNALTQIQIDALTTMVQAECEFLEACGWKRLPDISRPPPFAWWKDGCVLSHNEAMRHQEAEVMRDQGPYHGGDA